MLQTSGERGTPVGNPGMGWGRLPRKEAAPFGSGPSRPGLFLVVPLVLLGGLLTTVPLAAQAGTGAPSDTLAATDSLGIGSPDSATEIQEATPPQPTFPVFVVLGGGYGSRRDDCVLCESPEDNKSFTAHLSVGRPLGKGFGLGLDASVWRKGRPGTPGPADSTGVPAATTLANMLGNLSVSFSYQYWRVFVRAGGGVAFGSQDLEMTGASGDLIQHTASGWGVGYSAGAGITVPMASMVSLAFFGNWNVGHYDMVSPQGLTERAAKHEYFELGVGIAVR